MLHTQSESDTAPALAAKLSPLLKWPGGKRGLLKHITPLFPVEFGRYFEPFLGGGAVFFAIRPLSSLLSDVNTDLMHCYIQVRDRPDDIIDLLTRMPNTKDYYYSVRENEPTDAVHRAARLIYLAALSFNGIHRVNLNGKFNVPYGFKTHIDPCDHGQILAISAALSKSELSSGDFANALVSARAGDLVYLDPPYTTAHRDNGFVKYNAQIFSWADQIRLAELAHALDARGCCVVISNADHASIRSLYGRFKVLTIERPSRVAANDRHRRPITECIFYNWGNNHA